MRQTLAHVALVKGSRDFALRGIQPVHDIAEGPDASNAAADKTHAVQLGKLHMNWLGLRRREYFAGWAQVIRNRRCGSGKPASSTRRRMWRPPLGFAGIAAVTWPRSSAMSPMLPSFARRCHFRFFSPGHKNRPEPGHPTVAISPPDGEPAAVVSAGTVESISTLAPFKPGVDGMDFARLPAARTTPESGSPKKRKH